MKEIMDLVHAPPLNPIGIEVLQTEYSHLTWLAHLKFSNDSDSCYDRILVNLATVISFCHSWHPA
jgi:hypothetical protein